MNKFQRKQKKEIIAVMRQDPFGRVSYKQARKLLRSAVRQCRTCTHSGGLSMSDVACCNCCEDHELWQLRVVVRGGV